MRIAICDDENTFLRDLEEKIYKIIPRLDCNVEPFSCADDLLSSTPKYDIIFLDIEMGGMDGMTAARIIRQTDSEVPLVFLTSHTEMAIEGYEVNAFRFLKKPVDNDKLRQTLNDIRLMKASRRGVLIKSEGDDVLLIPAEVLFIESDNNNVRIVTTEGTISTRMKLSEAIDLLNGISDTFRRVHRCTAVNMAHVGRIREKEAVMDNGSIVGISRSHFAKFKNEMYQYIRKTAR